MCILSDANLETGFKVNPCREPDLNLDIWLDFNFAILAPS